jgi:putative lipoprotein
MIALVGAFACGCASKPADPWWGRDKAAHFTVSAALSAAMTHLAMEAGESGPRAHAEAVAAVLVLGAGKEAYDSRSGGTGWSWRDMSWNLLGALLGGVLVRLTD